MKNFLLSTFLAACAPENGFSSVDEHRAALECIEKLQTDVVQKENINISSIPRDVAHFEDMTLYEVLSGYRDDLLVILNYYEDNKDEIFKMEISSGVDSLEFGSYEVTFESGDFQVEFTFPGEEIDEGKGYMLLTDTGCQKLRGYAVYNFDGPRGAYVADLEKYLDKDLNLVEP